MITLNRRRVMGSKGSVESPNVVAIFDVTSTTEVTKIAETLTNVYELKVDNAVVPLDRYYLFETLGEHTVEYTLNSPMLQGQSFRQLPQLKEITFNKGVESLSVWCVYQNGNLVKATLPKTIKTIDTFAFSQCTNLATIIIEATTPPTLGSQVFRYNTIGIFYVPDDSVEIYKTAEGWSGYANRIKPMSELPQ